MSVSGDYSSDSASSGQEEDAEAEYGSCAYMFEPQYDDEDATQSQFPQPTDIVVQGTSGQDRLNNSDW